jgi:hypothetical protein
VVLTLSVVNNDPVVISNIPDQFLEQDFDSFTIDLNDVFSDVETSGLVYSTSGNNNVIITIDKYGVAIVSSTSGWSGTEIVVFIATDENGAKVEDEVAFTVELTSGLFVSKNKRVDVYPNPTTSWVTVDLQNGEIIQVYSEIGEELKVNIQGNQVDFSDLSAGLYFIKVGARYTKIVKE